MFELCLIQKLGGSCNYWWTLVPHVTKLQVLVRYLKTQRYLVRNKRYPPRDNCSGASPAKVIIKMHYIPISACQQGCLKVMFSVVSVCSHGRGFPKWQLPMVNWTSVCSPFSAPSYGRLPGMAHHCNPLHSITSDICCPRLDSFSNLFVAISVKRWHILQNRIISFNRLVK